jgi:hypothetical protein
VLLVNVVGGSGQFHWDCHNMSLSFNRSVIPWKKS